MALDVLAGDPAESAPYLWASDEREPAQFFLDDVEELEHQDANVEVIMIQYFHFLTPNWQF